MTEKQFLEELKKYIEVMEERVDEEWGDSRPLSGLIQDGEMPDIYAEVLTRLERA